MLKSRIHREVDLCDPSQFTSKNSQGQNSRTNWLRCTGKLKFQTGKAKRIDNQIIFWGLWFDFLYHIGNFLFALNVSLQNITYKKSFELRGWLHACQIEWKTSLWKNVICPWKVLEKKGFRCVWTMVGYLATTPLKQPQLFHV